MSDAKKTWVYADMVGDLFHAGHVEFLRRARAMGDGLIVGIIGDDDAATFRPRPIMSTAERVATMEACHMVDRVIAHAPLVCTRAHLDAIGAAFVVHGNDATVEELTRRYHDVMQADRLKLIPCARDLSSRDVVERIVERLRNGTLRIQV